MKTEENKIKQVVDAHMTLNRQTRKDVAYELGISEAHLSMIVSGKGYAGAELMIRMIEWSHGVLKAHDFRE